MSAITVRFRPAPTSPRSTAPVESRELVDRLLSQVEALKSEVRELTEGAAAAGSRHCSPSRPSRNLANRAPPVHWYSDPAALSSESRADRSRGASCRFRDGQRAHVLHCVRCSRAHSRGNDTASPCAWTHDALEAHLAGVAEHGEAGTGRHDAAGCRSLARRELNQMPNMLRHTMRCQK
jgi:hypothetical protein